MNSIAIASLLAAAATLTSAAPTGTNNQNQPRAWYVCASNGFRGECSVDPCAISWCPDYEPYTYAPKVSTPPAVQPVPTTPAPAKNFYRCASNGFAGDCSIDPCYGWSWCPDYEYGTVTPVKAAKRDIDPTVCAAGTGFFQSCSNGFRGCCKSDACGNSWCPDYKYGTYEPVAKTETITKRTDPTLCAAGTGFFQSCSNGFRGCCKSDACGNAWCPDYKYGTYEPISTVPKAETTPKTETVPKTETKPASVNVDPTVCPAGTGYYQVCASGFKGCCKTDACTKGYCSA